MVTEDGVQTMDDSIFGELDELALPALPDTVWMRLLANALDPDAPPAGIDLIPVDLPTDGPVDDGSAELGAADLGEDHLAGSGPDGADGGDGHDDDDDGSDLIPGAAHSHDGGADPQHDPMAHPDASDEDSAPGWRPDWSHPDADPADSGYDVPPWVTDPFGHEL